MICYYYLDSHTSIWLFNVLLVAESEKEEEEDDERKVETGKKNKRHETDQVFIAFARVYSGTIKRGQKLYILGPKHDPAKALDMVNIILKY